MSLRKSLIVSVLMFCGSVSIYILALLGIGMLSCSVLRGNSTLAYGLHFYNVSSGTYWCMDSCTFYWYVGWSSGYHYCDNNFYIAIISLLHSPSTYVTDILIIVITFVRESTSVLMHIIIYVNNLYINMIMYCNIFHNAIVS